MFPLYGYDFTIHFKLSYYLSLLLLFFFFFVVEVTSQRQGDTLFSSLTDLSAPKSRREPEDMLRYQKGRAEAFGALCSIFSSQDHDDPFQPIYLAKFYHALILGLHYTPEVSGPSHVPICEQHALTHLHKCSQTYIKLMCMYRNMGVLR